MAVDSLLWGNTQIFMKLHNWEELCTHMVTLRARPEPTSAYLQKLLVTTEQFPDVKRVEFFQCPEKPVQRYELGITVL